MSREKLLWGLCGALAAAVVALAVMAAGGQSPGDDASEPGGTAGEGGGGSGTPAAQSRIVAEAGSVALLEEEFLAGLKEAFGREYVQQWLKRTVVRLEAQALGIDVSRAEIDEELRRMQVGYESEAEFYRVMREQLDLSEQALRDDALYRLMLEKIATAGVTITDADVEAYIEANPEEFAPTHDVRYAQIVVESEERAAAVLEQLREGVEFSLLAQDLSVDEATAANGGDSGWVSENDPFIPEEVAEALAGMQVGDISPPLSTAEGHRRIVTLLGRRTIDPLDDSNVREDLRRELALAQAPSLFDVESSLLEKYNAVDFLSTD